MLDRIYTGYPWFRVERESISRDQVDSFPYLHLALLAAGRYTQRYRQLDDAAGRLAGGAFDRYVAARLRSRRIDSLIAASGSGFYAGRQAQRNGAIYICDRGSSHMRYQIRVMQPEYAKWSISAEAERAAAIRNEEREYEQADLIMVPSEFAYRSFVEMGVPKEKLRKAVLAADVSQFFPVSEPEENAFCVLFVGQVSFRKGIPYLLEAFSRLNHPRKRLRLIGSVDPRIREYLRTAPLDRVEFEGNQPRELVRKAMSEAHVTVLPSVEDGFGMVLAEAMACGSPVISTVNTGGPDLYRDGREGFIVPICDADALHGALTRLAEDASLRHAMAQASIEKMKHLGGWRQYGDVVEEHLRACREPSYATART
jgi:glycosyltransferase involved in cell wall biosynthesis